MSRGEAEVSPCSWGSVAAEGSGIVVAREPPLGWEVVGRQGATSGRSDRSSGSWVVTWSRLLISAVIPVVLVEVAILVSAVVRHIPEAVANLVRGSIAVVASVVGSSVLEPSSSGSVLELSSSGSVLELSSASSSSSVETRWPVAVGVAGHCSAKVVDVRRPALLVSLLRLASRIIARGAILATLTLRYVASITLR